MYIGQVGNETFAVITLQARLGSYPYISLLILEDRLEGITHKAICSGDVFEKIICLLRLRGMKGEAKRCYQAGEVAFP